MKKNLKKLLIFATIIIGMVILFNSCQVKKELNLQESSPVKGSIQPPSQSSISENVNPSSDGNKLKSTSTTNWNCFASYTGKSVLLNQCYLFTISYNQLITNNEYRILLTPLSGDPDLYLGYTLNNSSVTVRNSINPSTNNDEIIFKKSDFPSTVTTVNVWVYGFSTSNYTISFYSRPIPTSPDPIISTITGYTDGVGVSSAKWTGQPDRAPKTASNKFVGYYVVERILDSYYWDINGSNFGASQGDGKVWLLNNISNCPANNQSDIAGINVTILSWSDSKIRVKVKNSNNSLTFLNNVQLKITTSTTIYNKTTSKTLSIISLISSRGFGQCTFFVASKRLIANLPIPPTAYSNTPIDYNYSPKIWDCLTYSTNHVAIITSQPVQSKNVDGSISWAFTVGEFNATWNESESSSNRIFKVRNKSILTGIGSNSGYTATGYYR